MDKKQATIIVSLLVLIVCTGILATKAQSRFYVHSNELTPAGAQGETSDSYFAEAKLTRNETNEKYVESLKEIINDEKQSEETRESVSEEFAQFTVNSNNELKIEDQLKAEGFEETIVMINNNKANVTIKSDKKPTLEQSEKVQQVVLNISNIRDIEVNSKN